MGFDGQNFGLGVLTGWVSAYLVYRARHVISGVVESFRRGAGDVGRSTTRTAGSRYLNELIDLCQRGHLAGDRVKLSDLLIEPRFMPAPALIDPDDRDDAHGIYHVLPFVPDHPFLTATCNVETITVDDLGTGARALALLGQPGSGRTTALMALALYSVGAVNFKPPIDDVQRRLNAEESRLSEKERAVRVRDRIEMEQRAREEFATNRSAQRDTDKSVESEREDTKQRVPPIKRLLPIYVHLADVHLTSGDYPNNLDPAEPLVRTVQGSVGRITASTIPRTLYQALARGSALILIDGFDELPLPEQTAARAWLKALIEQYGENVIIVSGDVRGYGVLSAAGLTPLFLRPWSALDTQRFIDRWSQAWATIVKRRRVRVSDEVKQRALANNRALTPFDLTLKAWAAYAEDSAGGGVAGWLRAYLGRMVTIDEQMPALSQLGAVQMDEGFITVSSLQRLQAQPEKRKTTEVTPLKLNAAGDPVKATGEAPAVSADAAAEAPAKGKRRAGKEAEDAEQTSAQGRMLGALRRAGILVRRRGDRYQFRHHLLAAYAASYSLSDLPDAVVVERAMHPAWRMALPYAAAHRSLDNVVAARMRVTPDLLLENYLDMARWLVFAPSDVVWRPALLRYLGGQLVARAQYPVIRERVAAALVETRDKNALTIFRQAVRNADPLIRRLCSLGMGAIGDEEGLRDVMPLIEDREVDVQIAAAMALGGIGTTEALEPLVDALTRGNELVRRAAAETFALLPEEGYPTLFDAINDKDLLVRRAAVYGLRRIRTTWALVEIYRTFLEDGEWFVRSVAQDAFQEIHYGRPVSLTLPYPQPEAIPWLQKWATMRGEAASTREVAVQMLGRVVVEGDAELRQLAAVTIGQIGAAGGVRPLYNALRDGREEIRAAAHQALGALQLQLGERLPAPV